MGGHVSEDMHGRTCMGGHAWEEHPNLANQIAGLSFLVNSPILGVFGLRKSVPILTRLSLWLFSFRSIFIQERHAVQKSQPSPPEVTPSPL